MFPSEMKSLEARANALQTENALLRSQLRDAQEQAARDSATIAKLANKVEDLEEELFEFNF